MVSALTSGVASRRARVDLLLSTGGGGGRWIVVVIPVKHIEKDMNIIKKKQCATARVTRNVSYSTFRPRGKRFAHWKTNTKHKEWNKHTKITLTCRSPQCCGCRRTLSSCQSLGDHWAFARPKKKENRMSGNCCRSLRYGDPREDTIKGKKKH